MLCRRAWPGRLQCMLQARSHDRKIGYGPVKKGVRTSHFRSCKLCVSCFLGWVRSRVFSGFGAIDVYGPEPRTNTGPGVPVCSFLTGPFPIFPLCKRPFNTRNWPGPPKSVV